MTDLPMMQYYSRRACLPGDALFPRACVQKEGKRYLDLVMLIAFLCLRLASFFPQLLLCFLLAQVLSPFAHGHLHSSLDL